MHMFIWWSFPWECQEVMMRDIGENQSGVPKSRRGDEWDIIFPSFPQMHGQNYFLDNLTMIIVSCKVTAKTHKRNAFSHIFCPFHIEIFKQKKGRLRWFLARTSLVISSSHSGLIVGIVPQGGGGGEGTTHWGVLDMKERLDDGGESVF